MTIHAPATDGATRLITYSTLPSARARGWSARTSTLEQLHASLARHGQTVAQKDGPSLIGAVFREGEGRTKKTEGRHGRWRQLHLVERVELLMLDYDGKGLERPFTPAEVMAPWAGCAAISYSTWSHGTPEATSACMRVVLPYARPVSREEHELIYERVIAWLDELGSAPIDPACRDATRLMFTPRRKNPDASLSPFVELHEGAWLDPDALPWGGGVADLLEQKRVEEEAAERRREEARRLAAQKAAARRAATGRPEYRRAMTMAERAERELDRACEAIEAAGSGERIPTLFKKACWIGRWLWPGVLDEATTRARLIQSGLIAKPKAGEREIARHVNNGLRKGQTDTLEDVRLAAVREANVYRPQSASTKGSPEVVWPQDDHTEQRVEASAGASGDAERHIYKCTECQNATCTECQGDTCANTQEAAPIDLDDTHAKIRVESIAEREARVVSESLGLPVSRVILADDHGERPTLNETRAALAPAIEAAIRREGVTVIQAPPGSGKSVTTTKALVDYALEAIDHAREGLKVSVCVPTLKLAQEFEQLLKDMTRHEPLLRVGLAVTRNRDTCPAFSAFREAAAAAPEGGKVYCQACPRHGDKEACPFFARQGGARGANIVIKTHALEVALGHAGELEAIDIQVVDESTVGAIKIEGALGTATLAAMSATGELSNRAEVATFDVKGGAARSPIERVLSLLAHSALHPERRYGFKVLRKVCPAEAIELAPAYAAGWEALSAALSVGDHLRGRSRWDAQRRILAEAPRWQAIEALSKCLAHDWRGAYVQGGELHVSALDTFPTEHARTTLFLDATTTKFMAEAQFERDVHYITADVEQPTNMHVVQVDYSTGTHSGIAGRERPKSQLGGAVWLSCALRFGDRATTLNITNKAQLDAERSWTAPVFKDLDGETIYHQGPEARGSNRFEGFDMTLCDPWFVPGGAKDQLTDLLMIKMGADEDDEVARARCEAEAIWHYEGATMSQGMSRTRPYAARPGAPKYLISKDTRDMLALGYQRVTVLSAEVLAWNTLGHLPSVDEGASKDLMAEFMGQVLRLSGGVYAPTIDETAPDAMTLGDLHDLNGIGEWTRDPHAQQELYTAARESRVSTRLSSWIKRHFGSSWEAFAAATGCEITLVHTDLGGHPMPLLHTGLLDEASVRDWLRHTGATRYRLERDGVLGDWQRMSKLWTRLATVLACIHRLDREGLMVGEVVDRIAALTGASPRTVRRWIAAERAPGEDSRDALWRIWSGVHADISRRRIRAAAAKARAKGVVMEVRDALVMAAAVLTELGAPGVAAWKLPGLRASARHMIADGVELVVEGDDGAPPGRASPDRASPVSPQEVAQPW